MNSYAFRRAKSAVLLGWTGICAACAVALLLYILGYVFFRGVSYVNLDFFTHTPRPLGQTGGGAQNSFVGTLIMVGLASVIAIPIGMGAGIFVSEYAGPRAAAAVRFLADVLTGVPSIVIGLFIYVLLVVRMGHFSALAGGVALAVIMLPIVARTTEEMLKLVPSSQREAALALGVHQWRSIVSVVLPAARSGLLTGALLAIARAAGETAPLLFTSLGNNFLSTDVNKPMDALPLRIYRYAIGPYDDWHRQAWAAAFMLVMMVLVLNISARVLVGRFRGASR
jgi:phosphate transport system permease protein